VFPSAVMYAEKVRLLVNDLYRDEEEKKFLN
jgi:hypothetical protein